MVMREIFLFVLLLLIAGVGSVCVPLCCLRCNNVTEETTADPCPLCSNNTAQSFCDFKVSVNSSKSEPKEGDEVTLTCDHNLPNVSLTFWWTKDRKNLTDKYTRELFFKKVFSQQSGEYACFVNSPCGIFESLPHKVDVKNNSVVILVICGVSAVALIMIMGLAMKCKMRRDNAKHRQRRERQRQQARPSGGPPPLTPRES